MVRGVRLELKKAESAADSGVMVALRPPPDVAERLAVPDGSPADGLHVTLAYLGQTSDLPAGAVEALRSGLAGLAGAGALTGVVGGIAQFPPGDDGTPVWVPVDVPGLVELRQQVVAACQAAGAPPRVDHGFTPHLTLGYDITATPVPATPVTFTDVWLVVAGEWSPIPLSGGGLETKTAPPPPPAGGDDPGPREGRPVSPDEENVPTEDDPDADPRALSPTGAAGYFSDQWAEMTAWFFDDDTSMVGYISTPQEVIRVDDIDEWAREVDEAGLAPTDPPTDDTPPPAEPDSAAPAIGGGVFDFSDLEGKHLPGRHNQRRHGNRYGITAGKRVLRRLANEAGPRRQPGASPSTGPARRAGGPDPLRRRPTPPPKRKLSIEPDPDSRLPFNPDRVNSLQDLWEMNTDEATVDQLFRAKLRATHDPDLLDELDLLHQRKVDEVLAQRQAAEKAAAYKRMKDRERYRREHGSGLEGSDDDLDAMYDQFHNEVVPQRRDAATEATNGWFWNREALRKAERGDLVLPDDDEIFTGRLPQAFMRAHLSEDLKKHWNDTGTWPTGFHAWAGVGKDAAGKRRWAQAGGDTTWEDASAHKKPNRGGDV